jgi:hypothetical protein
MAAPSAFEREGAVARRYDDVLRNVVAEYRTEFERRAQAALARLEAAA